MGNNQSKNDDFSKKGNFDISRHNEAMRNLNANYTQMGYNLSNNQRYQSKTSESEFKTVHRTGSIYKPSIAIHMQPSNFKLQFQYDSDLGSKLQIYVGVHKITENPTTKLTQQIQSQVYFQQMLSSGKKNKFQKTYSLGNYNNAIGSNLILRILSLNSDQKTEYSLKNIGKQQWKILLQKLQFKGIVSQLHNIYKGGSDGDECIICLTEKVDTLIEPCNHMCLCFDCSDHLKRSNNLCPVCRAPIKSFKKIKSA